MNKILLAASILFIGISGAWAQTPNVTGDTSAFEMLEEVSLPVKDPTNSNASEKWVGEDGNRVVTGVTVPTLTPFLPSGEIEGDRPAIIIAPGGAFLGLTMDREGYDVARWLATNGVAAFVLKYRLIEPVEDGTEKSFADLLVQGMSDATEDATAAMSVVRDRANDWNIDLDKVGFLGFSAGAIAGFNATVLQIEPLSRPDILGLVYGPLAKPDMPLPSALPPLWAAVSGDDALFGSDIGLVPAWRQAGSSVELHYYENGGHGWGFPGAAGTTTTAWSDQFLLWLQTHQYVKNRP